MEENWKLWAALSLSALGNCIAWFHMNAQFKWDWAKSQWWVLLGGIPISFAFFYSTKYFYEYFNSYWSVRPIGFGIATIIFGVMTTLVLGEIPNQRILRNTKADYKRKSSLENQSFAKARLQHSIDRLKEARVVNKMSWHKKMHKTTLQETFKLYEAKLKEGRL